MLALQGKIRERRLGGEMTEEEKLREVAGKMLALDGGTSRAFAENTMGSAERDRLLEELTGIEIGSEELDAVEEQKVWAAASNRAVFSGRDRGDLYAEELSSHLAARRRRRWSEAMALVGKAQSVAAAMERERTVSEAVAAYEAPVETDEEKAARMRAEIMAVKDPAKCRKLIAENIGLWG